MLSQVSGNKHIGLFIEEGSGGLLNDLSFYGGDTAAILGNQQYTARNLEFFNAYIAISVKWDWGWTFKGMSFKNCIIGIQMDEDQASTGSITLIDSEFDHVDTAISTTRNIEDNHGTNGTLAMENVRFSSVNKVLDGPAGTILTEGNLPRSSNDLFIMVCQIIALTPRLVTKDSPGTCCGQSWNIRADRLLQPDSCTKSAACRPRCLLRAIQGRFLVR
jgi:glucan 1,3-beta-glucosidase